LSVNVLSNLTPLTDEIIDEMIKNPLLSVQTSVYSLKSAVHDGITQLPGSLEKTIMGLKRIVEAGIPAQISCPVMKQNKDDILEVIEWGRKCNVSVAIEPVIFASYDHSGENLSNRLSLEEVGNVIDCQLSEGYADIINDIAKEKESLKPEDPACSICRYSFCVSASGKVYPCVGWTTNLVGDLNKESLHEVWNNSQKIDDLRNVKRSDFPKCVDCKDRGYCNVCMMSNSNENADGDAFRINSFHCRVAKMKHSKLSVYR
jgi:radical SAM protein with 4Fe4S-binding SPASM domain